jgi:hypothetical protein
VRDRTPADWAQDLAQRHPLEEGVAAGIQNHPALTLLGRSTSSLHRLDYQLLGPGERLIEIELKAKRQPYVGWADLAPGVDEPDVMLLDELALRKVVDAGRYAFLLVRDLPSRRWAVWSTADLVLCSKVRATRRLAVGVDRSKGKLILDLREAASLTTDLVSALSAVVSLTRVVDRHWWDIAPWPLPAGQPRGAA